MGRKPIGDKPLTDTEKNRRWRAKKGETLAAKHDLAVRRLAHLRQEFDGYRQAQQRLIDDMVRAKYALIGERDAALRRVAILEAELNALRALSVVVPFPKKG